MKIVEECIDEDLGLNALAEKHYVNRSDIRKWSDAYRAHGLDGLLEKHQKYDGQFKVKVIEYMHSSLLKMLYLAMIDIT